VSEQLPQKKDIWKKKQSRGSQNVFMNKVAAQPVEPFATRGVVKSWSMLPVTCVFVGADRQSCVLR
jgi:hypothetical protein